MKIVTSLTIIGVLLPLCTNGEKLTNRNHENILSRFFALSNPDTDYDTIFGDYYSGIPAFWKIEVPLFFLQLVKFGDDILIPSVSWYNDGFTTISTHVVSKAKLSNITTTKVQASMNGNEFRVGIIIGDVDIICPECTLDKETRSLLPPWGSEGKTFYRGFSLFIKNFVLNMTCNVTMGEHGLQLSNLDLHWKIENFLGRRENSTYTSPSGDVREQGRTEIRWHEKLMDEWRIDEENFERRMQKLFNCFLSNGRPDPEECYRMDEPLHRQTIAEIFHGFGLAALNKQRALERESNINVEEDPIRTANRLLFEYGTHILQSGKMAATIQEDYGLAPALTFPIKKTYSLNYTKPVCDNNNNNCEDVHEYIQLGGEINGTETTVLLGVTENNAEIVFGMSNFSYSFTVPNMTLTSTDYERISTNLNTGVQMEYRGGVLTVTNSMIGVTGDFEFVEGHFQVSNLRLMMDLGEVSMSIFNVVKSENGSVSELQPIHEDAAPMVMALWGSKDESGVALEERYTTFLQATINDFLAGRSSI